MIIVPIAEVKARLSEYLRASEKELVVLTRRGRPTAVLLSLNDEDLEELILARSPRMRAILDQSWESIQAGMGIPHEDFWAEIVPEE